MWKEKEYLKLLESSNIDTTCFMGSGYEFNDYKVGQEFYFPFAWYSIDAVLERGFNLDMCLQQIKIAGLLPTDRFKIVSKYKFRKNQINGRKIRDIAVLVKNLRTMETKKLKEHELYRFYWLLMAEPI